MSVNEALVAVKETESILKGAIEEHIDELAELVDVSNVGNYPISVMATVSFLLANHHAQSFLTEELEKTM